MAHNLLSPNKLDDQRVDQETRYEPNFYTWTVAGARFLAEHLQGVRLFTQGFDYSNFLTEGEGYLGKLWSQVRLEDQRNHASPGLEKEKRIVKEFMERGTAELAEFTVTVIEELLNDNLLIAQVNWCALYGWQGERAHFVLVYRGNDKEFEFHDPGQPPRRCERTSTENFLNAFRWEMIAIAKPQWLTRAQRIPGRNDRCLCGSGRKYKKCHGTPG